MTKEPVEIHLPKLGESILSATVVQWFKKEGDLVERDETLLEVATDKINSEIPSPVAGVLVKIMVEPDQEVEVGAALAVVALDQGAYQATAIDHTQEEKPSAPCPLQAMSKKSKEETNTFLTPAVARLVEMHRLSRKDLEAISGSGHGGRITRRDVELFVAGQKSETKSAPVVSAYKMQEKEVEYIRMTPMRKAIADHMALSSQEIPHATVVMEVDVTALMKMIVEKKDKFLQEHGCKLTVTSFFVKAIAMARNKFPLVNASLVKEEGTIAVKADVNIGVAVSIDADQGLVVPVIRACQRLTLAQIAKSLTSLADRARRKQLKPDDVTGGTITLTNFGMSGASIGFPIIHHLEAAIVGAGVIKKRVMVMDDDSLAIRQMMFVSLAFDHRIMDGMYACAFLQEFKDFLENKERFDSV